MVITMKLLRYQYNGISSFGQVEGDRVHRLTGDLINGLQPSGEYYPLADVTLLPPCQPSKIVAVGLNYRDHAVEFGEAIPDVPKLFLKPSTAVIGPGEDIRLPEMAARVDYEAELAVVIGKQCKHILPADAPGYILGYTCLNDVTARDVQAHDGQWTRAKGFDTFAPIGPVIQTELDPGGLDIRLIHNGAVKQQSNTRHFIFPVPELVSFISRVMTLLPGDVITTGTPSGIGALAPGDSVSVEIAGIGTLTNGVSAE